MREGDYLVAIGDRDVKWSSHEEVVKEIKASANKLKLKLVTPLDKGQAKGSSYKDKVRDRKSFRLAISFCCILPVFHCSR